MPPVGFEPTIVASARPQTYALERAATGISSFPFLKGKCEKPAMLQQLSDKYFARLSNICVKGLLRCD
jgi:hypothetical protein